MPRTLNRVRRSPALVLAAVAASIALASTLSVQRASAQNDTDAERFEYLVNQERQARGIRPLAIDTAVTGTSCDWNKTVMATRRLDHDPQLEPHVAVAVPDLAAWAENLGTGPTPDDVHKAWMASSAHEPHIVDPNLELVGICTDRDSNNQLWVTERFATSRPPATPVQSPPPRRASVATSARTSTTTAPPPPTTTAAPPTAPPASVEVTTTDAPIATTTSSSVVAEVALAARPASSSSGEGRVAAILTALVVALVLAVLLLVRFIAAKLRRGGS